MKKVKIIYNRKECIGAATCAVIDPKRWKIADDGKADLIGGTKTEDGKWELELEVSEEELKTIKEGAVSCPVQVIEVKD